MYILSTRLYYETRLFFQAMTACSNRVFVQPLYPLSTVPASASIAAGGNAHSRSRRSNRG